MAVELVPAPVTTFRQFADIWLAREGSRLASGAIDKYRLKLLDDFVLPGTNPPVMFGDKAVGGVALGDIEAWREARRRDRLRLFLGLPRRSSRRRA